MGTREHPVYDGVATPRPGPGWELGEETMPESVLYDEAVALLKALLAAWAARRGDAFVVRNLAIRWDRDHPAYGVDPDVALIVPRPPDAETLRSLCTWKEGHTAPILAVEVVSETNPRKDYEIAPDKYAASGVGELWMFDPLLSGPESQGGPFRIQVWVRRADGTFVRSYGGDGPALSPTLGAHLLAVDEGRRLRIVADVRGEEPTSLWLTSEEAERAAKEAERAAKEAERAAKEAALARVAELERLLAERGL